MKLIAMLVCLALAWYTSHKLCTMAQIRGWLPGATVTTCPVLQKWTEAGERGTDYMIAWDDPNHSGKENTENVSRELWERLRPGDTVEVVRGVGDPHDHNLRNGIFADNGNVSFDIMLLLCELGGATLLGYRGWKEFSG